MVYFPRGGGYLLGVYFPGGIFHGGYFSGWYFPRVLSVEGGLRGHFSWERGVE